MDDTAGLVVLAVVVVCIFVVLPFFLLWLFKKIRRKLLGLHPKLAAYAAEKHLDEFEYILKKFEKQLRKVKCPDWEVELVRLPKMSFWKRFLSSDGLQVEQCMLIRGQVNGRSIQITQPMGSGKLMAFFLDIDLDAPITFSAVRENQLLGKRWDVEPSSEQVLQCLESLPLPKTRTRHYMAGVGATYKQKLFFSHGFCPSPDAPDKTRWTVFEGNQGFFGRHSPRLVRFFDVASDVEAILRDWAPRITTVNASQPRMG